MSTLNAKGFPFAFNIKTYKNQTIQRIKIKMLDN